MKSFLKMLPIIVMAAAFLPADDGALAQDFSPPIVTAPAQSVDALRDHFAFMALRTAKMPPDNVDLDSMLLVNVNGQSLVPIIKKRKARKGFTSVRPAENTPILKSNYEFSK